MNLEVIYQTHGEMVYNLSLSYVGNSSDAQEITQDVFLAVYNHVGEFKNKSSLKTWVYRITINKSLDFIKAKQRKKRSFFYKAKDIHDPSLHLSDYHHPGVELEHKESVANIMRAIQQLPENQKTVLILLKIEGLKNAEVAEILDLTPKAIESLFQRAKKKLKEILDSSEE